MRTVQPMQSIADVMTLVATQARTRAERRASTLPMVMKMGAAAVAIELTMRAADDEAVLSVLGVPGHSPLRRVAEHLPQAAERTAQVVTRLDQLGADVLAGVASRVHAASYSSTGEAEAAE